MSIITNAQNGLRQIIKQVILEGPARRAGIDRLIHNLEKSGQAIEKRVAGAQPRPSDHETLAHLTGIERWSQHRLKVALGAPLVNEEYDPYRPDETDWPALQAAFHATRQETLSLVKSLRMAGIDPAVRVPHNDFGALSLLGWLRYMDSHASIESRKIQPRA